MPKVNQNAAADESAPQRLKITVKDGTKVYHLDSDELGPKYSRLCRQQTGQPYESYLENFGSDSMVVVIWLSRLLSGEPNLLYSQVEAKYDTNKKLSALEFEFNEEKSGETSEDEDPLAD